MSELIDNSATRREMLRGLILRLNAGDDPRSLREEFEEQLRNTPPADVIAVEQELISSGVRVGEILEHCDAHSFVVRNGLQSQPAQELESGHPLQVLRDENAAILTLAYELQSDLSEFAGPGVPDPAAALLEIRAKLNRLMDVDKHYKRKEYLLFPFLEKYGFTGPSEVMWAKHDRIREQLGASIDVLAVSDATTEEITGAVDLVVRPALAAVIEMVAKEEHILLPVLREKLTAGDWLQVHQQTMEYGFCLVEPAADWKPATAGSSEDGPDFGASDGMVRFSTGMLKAEVLEKVLNSLPFDMTFVDHEDKVRYFSHGPDRIFSRSRAILGRNVKHCHPPASAHIVEKILEDFRAGRESRAPFWIRMGPRFIHIEYFAIRSDAGEYLGTLEVSQNVAPYRALEGEQRILQYRSDNNG